METAVISFELDTTDPTANLGFEFWVDDILVSDIGHVMGPSNLQYELGDNEADHKLKFVLKNKTWDHTKLDELGNIEQDACLIIKNLTFDEVELGHAFVEHAEYHHSNNNPNNDLTVQKFYGQMGCNGYVVLNFCTPIYLWLLENL